MGLDVRVDSIRRGILELFPPMIKYSLTSKGKRIIKFAVGLLDIATKGRIRANILVGLVYHEVSDNPSKMALDTKTFTSISTFNKQMSWVCRLYAVIDISQTEIKHKRGDLVLSFDDGYRSFKNNALPLIRKFGYPVICFINSSTINKQINASALVSFESRLSREPTLWKNSNPEHYSDKIELLNSLERDALEAYQGEYLTWEDLKELSTDPLIKFGNHLQNHWYSPRLTDLELRESIKLNEQENSQVVKLEKILAWPHGASTKLLSSIASEEGMKIQMFGVDPTPVNKNTQVVLRVDMNQGVSSYPNFRGSLLIARLKTHSGNKRKANKITY